MEKTNWQNQYGT